MFYLLKGITLQTASFQWFLPNRRILYSMLNAPCPKPAPRYPPAHLPSPLSNSLNIYFTLKGNTVPCMANICCQLLIIWPFKRYSSIILTMLGNIPMVVTMSQAQSYFSLLTAQRTPWTVWQRGSQARCSHTCWECGLTSPCTSTV